MKNKSKIAFIIPRYGFDINGGAELHCRQLAEKLTFYYDVTVLTTCAQNYMIWDNFYNEGDEKVNNVLVKRFKNDQQRNKLYFDKLSSDLINNDHPTNSCINQWMQSQGPVSNGLCNYIDYNHHNYCCFIFFSYSYATTWFNIKTVSSKSILIPLVHEDWCLKLGIWDNIFKQCKFIIFNSEPERKLVKKLYPTSYQISKTLGVGVSPPLNIHSSLTSFENLLFYVYVGRVEHSKGCQELFDYHLKLQDDFPSLHLILVGKVEMPIPRCNTVISLGYISEELKFKVIQQSQFVVLPSTFESLSMITLEAFTLGKVVLGNYYCNVMRYHYKKSRACLLYKNFKNFQKSIKLLLNIKKQNRLGKRAKKYIQKHYNWNSIIKEYQSIINNFV